MQYVELPRYLRVKDGSVDLNLFAVSSYHRVRYMMFVVYMLKGSLIDAMVRRRNIETFE